MDKVLNRVLIKVADYCRRLLLWTLKLLAYRAEKSANIIIARIHIQEIDHATRQVIKRIQ